MDARTAEDEFAMLLRQMRRMGQLGSDLVGLDDVLSDLRRVRRGDVEEVAQVTGMSVKASRKLLRKYQGDKDEALMAWFDREVDSAALEEASDSEGDTEHVQEDVPLHCDWPTFPDVVEWVAQTSGAKVHTTSVTRADESTAVPAGTEPNIVLPAGSGRDDLSPRRRRRRQEEERELFAGLTIGQAVRVRRYHKDMRQSRCGWQETDDFSQQKMCGKVGTIMEVRRRDLCACIDVATFGRTWWDVRWLDPLPPDVRPSAGILSGHVTLEGERKQVKLARRCIRLLTTLIRVGDLGTFLGPVRKALERVVPMSKGEVMWKPLTKGVETIGYQLCILNPSVVTAVAAALEGDLFLRIDKQAGVSEEVVARVGKLARTKTGCAVVSAPRGVMKMDQGALVIRNERYWEMGNVDGLRGNDVAPGLVIGTEPGKCEVCWFRHRGIITMHRWGADDAYDVRLMPSYEQLGRLLVLLVCVARGIQTRVPPWQLMPRLTRDVLASEGGDMLRRVLQKPEFCWTGTGYSAEFDTNPMANALISEVVQQWRKDGVIPPKAAPDALEQLVQELQAEPAPVGGHLGMWREAKVSVHKFYCSRAAKRDGPLCQHPGGTVTPHWSCCGQMAPTGHCRQDPPRICQWHQHPLCDSTMSLINWTCSRCCERGMGHEAQRWRCVLEDCDYDLCDACMEDSFYKVKSSSVRINVDEAPPAELRLTSAKGNQWLFTCSEKEGELCYSVNEKAKRRATSIRFTQDTADGRPVLEVSDPLPVPALNGPVNGFTEGQLVYAAKDIFVQGRRVASEGSPGVVKGVGTSADTRRINVRFEECVTALNCLPHEIRPTATGRRWVCVESSIGKVPVLPSTGGHQGAPLAEIPNWDDVELLEEAEGWARVISDVGEGYVQRKYIRENPRQQSGVALPRDGLEVFLGQLRGMALKSKAECDIPPEVQFDSGGKVPAVVVSGLQECHDEWMNGVYRRWPAEADTLVVFGKGDAVLYFKNGWWRLYNSRNFRGWLWSSRSLVGQWSESNTEDSLKVKGREYPRVDIAEPRMERVVDPSPPPGSVSIRLPSQDKARSFVELEARVRGTSLVYTHSGDGLERPPFSCIDFDPTDYFLTFTDIKKGTPLLQEGLADVLGGLRALANKAGVLHNIPDEVEVWYPVPPKVPDRTRVSPARLDELTKAAVATDAGPEVGAIVEKFGWSREQGAFTPFPEDAERAAMARELHTLLGDALMTPANADVGAPNTSTIAIVGRKEGRDRARGYLSRLRDLREVAIRVPSECHAVVERHRLDIQRRANAHMNVGFGGAIVRLTGTKSAITRSRRAIAALLTLHWREQQRQRRSIVLEQVVANAMEVRVKVPICEALYRILEQQSASTVQSSPRRFDEDEAEKKQMEARMLSQTQELTREYDRLASSLRDQLLEIGLSDDVQVCADEFLRGDRVRRGPTWIDSNVDGGDGNFGTVLGNHDIDGYVMVEWDKTGKLVRHRKGPLWADLKAWDPVRLPRMLTEGVQSDVVKQRAGAHAVHQMDVLRECSKCKAVWAEEEAKQKDMVREARKSAVRAEFADHFQGWLRTLLNVRLCAAEQVAAVQALVDKGSAEVAKTHEILAEVDGKEGAGAEESVDESSVCVSVVTPAVLSAQDGAAPADVATKMALPGSHRLWMPKDATVEQCAKRLSEVDPDLADPILWAFQMMPNSTLRCPKMLTRDSPAAVVAACPSVRPGDAFCAERQIFVHSAEPKLTGKHAFIICDEGTSVAGETSRDAGVCPLQSGELVEVLDDEGQLVEVRRNDVRCFVPKDAVKVVTSVWCDPRKCSQPAVLFFKRFHMETGSITRKGFTCCDASRTTVAQLLSHIELQCGIAGGSLVYVEESPESFREITAGQGSVTLAAAGVESGAVLVCQPALPPSLQFRTPRVGDQVSLSPFTDASIVTGGLRRGEDAKVVSREPEHLVLETASGEKLFHHPGELLVSPRSDGFAFSHATVPAWFQHFVHKREGPAVTCPQGHRLLFSHNPRQSVCNACGAEGINGMSFWGCRGCDWDLCVACYLVTRGGLADPSNTAYRAKGRVNCRVVRRFLQEHADRVQRMLQSVARHHDQLSGAVNEALMHVRRMSEERQHRRRFGQDLLLQLMDDTGCLLELEADGVLVVGRHYAVGRAKEKLEALQSAWPPPSVPVYGTLTLGTAAAERLFGRGGLLARGIQFECGCDAIERAGDDAVVYGPRDAVERTAASMRCVLQLDRVPPIAWAEAPGSTVVLKPESECPVCLLEVEADGEGDERPFAGSCGHPVHTGCAVGLLASHAADSKREPLLCPAEKCDYVYRAEEYGALLDAAPEETTRALSQGDYYDALLLYALRRHPKVVSCPFEGCEGWAVVGSTAGAVENLYCFECERLFCPICRQRGHFFSRCEDVRVALRNRAGEEAKKQLEEDEASRKAIASLCRPCPRCGAQVSRTEGCPHMTCKVCKFEFCYDCLRPIPHQGECDKSRLEDRMRRIRAEHDGIIYHKYTQCDSCGMKPIPEGEPAWTCLHCLHWSICSKCETSGVTCGRKGHVLAELPRGDEPPAEAVAKGERQKWRQRLADAPFYDDIIVWDELLRRDVSSSMNSAVPACLEFTEDTKRRGPRRHTATAASCTPPGRLSGRPGESEAARKERRASAVVGGEGAASLRRFSHIGLKRADTGLFQWEESGDEGSGSASDAAEVMDADGDGEGSEEVFSEEGESL